MRRVRLRFMREFEFSTVAPLLSIAVPREERVDCLFRCPRSGVEVPSWGAVPDPSGQPTPRWPQSLLGALATVQRALQGSAEPESRSSLSAEQFQAAVVSTFQAVAYCFTWDEGTWVARDAAQAVQEFTEQLKQAPLKADDRRLLAKLMWQLAPADGEIHPAELALLEEFGIVRQLGPITPEDYTWATPGKPREIILLLGWALALSDERLHLAELELLEQLAEDLGVPFERTVELKKLADLYVYHRGRTEEGSPAPRRE